MSGAESLPQVPPAIPAASILKLTKNGKKDFSEIIGYGKTLPAPDEIETGNIVGGFAHNQVTRFFQTAANRRPMERIGLDQYIPWGQLEAFEADWRVGATCCSETLLMESGKRRARGTPPSSSSARLLAPTRGITG